jgi:hypothetical protein
VSEGERKGERERDRERQRERDREREERAQSYSGPPEMVKSIQWYVPVHLFIVRHGAANKQNITKKSLHARPGYARSGPTFSI